MTNYNIENKSEKISKFVDKMAAKYDWFCPNGWVADDIAVNFCCKAFLDDDTDIALICDIINNQMPNWLKAEAADACLVRAQQDAADVYKYNYEEQAKRISTYIETARLLLN